MKYRICILLFLVFLSFVWFSVDDFQEGFYAGYEDRQEIFVEPLEVSDTEYIIQSVSVKTEKEKNLNILESIFTVFLGIAMLCSLVCFVEVLLSVRKKKVFIRQNVYRMRIIAYTFIAGTLYYGVKEYFLYEQARQLVELPEYQTEMYRFPFGSLLLVLFFAVFTEIYAQGVWMKEEQELTV